MSTPPPPTTPPPSDPHDPSGPSPQQPYGTPPNQSANVPPAQPYGSPQGQPSGATSYEPQSQSSGFPSPSDGPGFFKALFDLQFRHFVTLKFASFIYVLGIAVSALFWLVEIISGIVVAGSGEGAGLLIAAILLGWIPPLIWIITFRLSIEFVIAIIRTSQNTSELVDRR
ncbi:MAG: DUF4282 domain-containing protein [Pauljensenia sp.]